MIIYPFKDEDLYLLPHSGGDYILYAPLRRALISISPPMVQALQNYLNNGSKALSETEKSLLGHLAAAEMFQGEALAPPIQPSMTEFLPHQVTLFLTSRCNLRCTYCYADAGRKNIEMPWEVAKAAIDLVVANALTLGSPRFMVGFHGGGEPTVAWKLLTKATDYAHQLARENNLEVDIFAASNGLLSPKQRKYISEKFTNINISLDGPEDIQNLNRPKVNGEGSWPEIRDSLFYFDQQEFPYGFRATITKATVERLPEIVTSFIEQFQPQYIQLEPAWSCGRCLTSGEEPPDDQLFIEKYLEAKKLAAPSGINVHYSAARLDTLTSKFCAAPGDNFTVLPEGVVTSCYEITEFDDPRAELFHYGKFDFETEKFQFQDERLARLRSLTVDQFHHCSDCFCKWHCAGDCLSKVFAESGSTLHSGSSRCDMNRTLTKHQLVATLEENRKENSHTGDNL